MALALNYGFVLLFMCLTHKLKCCADLALRFLLIWEKLRTQGLDFASFLFSTIDE